MSLKRIRYVLVFVRIIIFNIFNKLFLKSASSKIHRLPFVFQLLNELSRTQSSVSEHQEHIHRQQQEMGRRLQEKDQTIKAQREQVNTDAHTHTYTAITSQRDYVGRGSEAEGPRLFRISCICYMGSHCVVLRHDDTVHLTGANVHRKPMLFLE